MISRVKTIVSDTPGTSVTRKKPWSVPLKADEPERNSSDCTTTAMSEMYLMAAMLSEEIWIVYKPE